MSVKHASAAIPRQGSNGFIEAEYSQDSLFQGLRTTTTVSLRSFRPTAVQETDPKRPPAFQHGVSTGSCWPSALSRTQVTDA